MRSTICALGFALGLTFGCGSGSRTGQGGVPAPTGRGPGAPGDGPILAVPGGLLKIQLCAEGVVRVAYATDPAFFGRPTLMTAQRKCDRPAFRVTGDGAQTTVSTSKLIVRVDAVTGAVTFADPAGHVLLAEKEGGGRSILPVTVHGERTQSVRQEWTPDADESLYGLGQHQQGRLDIRGMDLDLYQHNTEVFIPFLVSSKGYGVLWDNTSHTRFGDLTDAVPLPGTTGLYGPADAPGGLPGDVAPGAASVEWAGNVTPAVTGDYLFRTFYTGTLKLSVNGSPLIDHYRQDWLPNEDVARVKLTAGVPAAVKLAWTRDGNSHVVRLLWKPPVANPATSLWSQVGDGIDYWFVYGPDLDEVVSGYRRLTGEVPMMPRWAFGLWQSKERYRSAQEVLDVLKGYRDRGAPIDNIVQDWRYWPDGQWGSHRLDPERYPDPAAWMKTIHDGYHAHLMISVWPRFYPETSNFSALHAMGFLYPLNIAEKHKDFLGHEFAVYDAFNPAARRMYWSQIDEALFSRNVDAWWLDGSEAEIVQGPFDDRATEVALTETHMSPTALGSGARVLNAFPLVNSQAVYEGQRGASPNQRVFILTRSGFAGQQRYAAATWSGDITSTWTAMKKQIPAGLGYAISGMPYWTFDSGGFSVPARFSSPTARPADLAEWYELNARWFEYATFVPILRLHGQSPPREIWEFGGETSPAYGAMLKFDRLRYRLLPYVYSLAGMVTQRAGTIIRPLVMDFRGDRTAREVADEYMFGPAFLVSPVTSYMARARAVYLPPATGWYDLWTGARREGGQWIQAAAPFDAIPVYVRAGSIVPIGPELQYTSEKPADPITLYVYAGEDGAFTLYEDQGTTYDYERGAFSTIRFSWDDAKSTLTVGARAGSFDGMLAERRFRVVLVRPTRAVGLSASPGVAEHSVLYRGAEVRLVLE
jgi:alpha-D-xyloside xylohydrolase